MRPALQVIDTVRPTDDDALLAEARGGDVDALDLLVRRYLKDVYNLTYRLLGDYDLAQDAAQDAMVNAVRALSRFRGESSFRTWLLRIALNSARSVGRRKTRRREVSIDVVAESAQDVPDASSIVARNEEAEIAARALAQLPEKQRQAVTLRTQQGLSYLEIGALLDCSEGAARVNYHLGVKRLRELIK